MGGDRARSSRERHCFAPCCLQHTPTLSSWSIMTEIPILDFPVGKSFRTSHWKQSWRFVCLLSIFNKCRNRSQWKGRYPGKDETYSRAGVWAAHESHYGVSAATEYIVLLVASEVKLQGLLRSSNEVPGGP